ncbi:CRISPR-associated protein Cas5 [Hydrogenophaga taeniospiralis CCUG 15921]|uniref:CRISPR-associated protein Cas5 n=1 Tax=Hydrogenophaga taeniospiralis CCUG 15921 TaxID=1281780 RepID=A0A9X4SBQ2_9BURK|nr:type I-E CRISPR-associated protein Cas5/CasD [Hydrogenophaga taeniospiralis]MDG5975723.1 CRISPR-associated protein Cas5 [Hydrogenophaga taeniospiralis CCUG 15921]
MARHLLIRLSSPLIAFGGETIDNFGVIRDFPALSMVTGLIANALGWDRGDDVLHNRLQERLRVGTRLETQAQQLREYQTAELFEDDAGWTTFGQPEGRAKSPSYSMAKNGRKSLTLQRYRDYHADLTALIALRLAPAEESPMLDEVAQALDQPQRPLFIGRKPCLPVGRLVAGWIDADSVLQALQLAPLTGGLEGLRAQWPDGEGQLPGDRLVDVCDERNWTSGVHGGWRPVREGLIKNAGNMS